MNNSSTTQDVQPVTTDKPYIEMALTPQQQAACASLLQRARHAGKLGKPGMIAAQIFGDHMRVGFIRHEAAVKIKQELKP